MPNEPERDLLVEKAHEQAVRDFWAAREPEYDEISVSVRRGGKLVRFVLLTPDDATTLRPASSSAAEPAG